MASPQFVEKVVFEISNQKFFGPAIFSKMLAESKGRAFGRSPQ